MRLTLPLLLVALLLTACSASPTPEAAFEAFATDIGSGNISKAVSMTKPTLSGVAAERAGNKWAKLTEHIRKSGGIDKITTKCDTVGEASTCKATITLKNGSSEQAVYGMIKSDGAWFVNMASDN